MSSPAPPTVDTPDEPQSDGSKLRTFLGILKKFVILIPYWSTGTRQHPP